MHSISMPRSEPIKYILHLRKLIYVVTTLLPIEERYLNVLFLTTLVIFIILYIRSYTDTVLFAQGTRSFDSRYRSIGYTKSRIGKVARHSEFAPRDCGATVSQRHDGSGHEQRVPSRFFHGYRW